MGKRQTPKDVDMLIGTTGYPDGRCAARAKKKIRLLGAEAPYDQLRCTNPVVPGRNTCRYHGALGGHPVWHGKDHIADHHIPIRLRDKYENFLSDPNWANLSHEVALIRSMIDDYMELHYEDDDEEGVQRHVSTLIEKASKVMETKHRIEYGETYNVNVNSLVSYAAQIASIINQYIETEDNRLLAANAIRALFAGMDMPQLGPGRIYDVEGEYEELGN